MLRFCICAVLAMLVCSSAAAQQSDILVHYLAYRAALERRDLAAAESEAELALAASEARDGTAGRTGVLALNLAVTRLLRGDAAGALPSAQRANALARQGAAGLDVDLAEVVLGRVELAVSGRPGAERLQQILRDGGLDRVPEEDAYTAAAELGHWALRQQEYETAIEAWSTAAAHAAGSNVSEEFGYARARTWQAAAIFFDEIRRARHLRINRDRGQEAYRTLAQATEILRPMAEVDAPNLELTIAQQAYADALALRSIVRAKMTSDHQPLPRELVTEGDADGVTELRGPVDLSRPRCLLRLITRPLPEFPEEAEDHDHLAGLVLRLQISAEGAIEPNRVISRVGDEEFARAAETASTHWRVERREDSPTNCRMQQAILVSINFVLGTPY